MNATGKSINHRQQRYRRSSALQEKAKERARRSIQLLSQYSEWRKVAALRKRVHEIRDSLTACESRMKKLEIKLLNFAEQLVEAEEQWKKVKPHRKARLKPSITPLTMEVTPLTR